MHLSNLKMSLTQILFPKPLECYKYTPLTVFLTAAFLCIYQSYIQAKMSKLNKENLNQDNSRNDSKSLLINYSLSIETTCNK